MELLVILVLLEVEVDAITFREDRPSVYFVVPQPLISFVLGGIGREEVSSHLWFTKGWNWCLGLRWWSFPQRHRKGHLN